MSAGESNSVRGRPTTDSWITGQLSNDSTFVVLDGPVCANGHTWWQVQQGDLIGWTVESDDSEYWLEPTSAVTGTATPTQAADSGNTSGSPESMVKVTSFNVLPFLSTPLFHEEFTDNQNQWFIEQDGNVDYNVVDGVYQMYIQNGRDQTFYRRFLSDFGIEPLRQFYFGADYRNLGDEVTDQCAFMILNHDVPDPNRYLVTQWCQNGMVSFGNYDGRLAGGNAADVMTGAWQRLELYGDGETVYAGLNGEIVLEVPFDFLVESITIGTVYRNQPYPTAHTQWDNYEIGIPMTCPYSVSMRIDEVRVLNSVEADTTSVIGGDEAYVWYGVSASPPGGSGDAFDFGGADRYLFSWTGDLYDLSKVTNYPTLTRVVSCDQDVYAYVQLAEADTFVGTSYKDLGSFSTLLTPETGTISETQIFSGHTIDGDFEYEVTYTIEVVEEVLQPVDTFQVSSTSVMIDNSEVIVDNSSDSPGNASGNGNTVQGGSSACVMQYGDVFSYQGTESYYSAGCDFDSEAGDQIQIIGNAESVVIYSPDGEILEPNSVSRDGFDYSIEAFYTLPSTGRYTIWVSSFVTLAAQDPDDCPFSEYDQSGNCLNDSTYNTDLWGFGVQLNLLASNP